MPENCHKCVADYKAFPNTAGRFSCSSIKVLADKSTSSHPDQKSEIAQLKGAGLRPELPLSLGLVLD